MAAGGKVVGHCVLEAGEVALTVRAVHLADRNNSGRTRPLMAVGTSFAAGPPRRPPAPHHAASLGHPPSCPGSHLQDLSSIRPIAGQHQPHLSRVPLGNSLFAVRLLTSAQSQSFAPMIF